MDPNRTFGSGVGGVVLRSLISLSVFLHLAGIVFGGVGGVVLTHYLNTPAPTHINYCLTTTHDDPTPRVYRHAITFSVSGAYTDAVVLALAFKGPNQVEKVDPQGEVPGVKFTCASERSGVECRLAPVRPSTDEHYTITILTDTAEPPQVYSTGPNVDVHRVH